MFKLFCKPKKNEKVSVEKPVEKVEVHCKYCNEQIKVDASSVMGVPVGYKGRCDFYAKCPRCTKKVKIDESKLPKKVIRTFYEKFVWN